MEQAAETSWRFKILIDGDCPLCRLEGDLLRRLDRGRGRLAEEDIASDDFDASRYGRSQQDVMDRIHGVLPDGTVIEGVEVFRRAYGAVGWGWLWAPTRWPVIRPIVDAAYRWFARHRLRLTGRADEACASGRCEAKRSATGA